MSDFKKAYQKTMGIEGYYANNPADAGGQTFAGIARKYWPTWRGWSIIDTAIRSMVNQPRYGSPEYATWVKCLNTQLRSNPVLMNQVQDFYCINFWGRMGEIDNQDIADWLFDHAVNGGGQGIKWMQEAADIETDGAIGPETIRAFNGQNAGTLLKKAEIVAAWYRIDKVHDKPSQAQFLNSWLSRDGVDADVIRMARAYAKDGLTDAEVSALKDMVKEAA